MPASIIPVSGLKLGFVGEITREGRSLRSAKRINPGDTYNVGFGESVVLNANNTYSSVKSFIAGGGIFTPSTRVAIAVRNVRSPFSGTYSLGVGGASTSYAPGQIADACLTGTVAVQVNSGTPVANGSVYIRVALNPAIPNGVIGGFEASPDGANNYVVLSMLFETGYLDTDGTAEVTTNFGSYTIPTT